MVPMWYAWKISICSALSVLFGEALLDDLEWLGFEWDEGPRVGGLNYRIGKVNGCQCMMRSYNN